MAAKPRLNTRAQRLRGHEGHFSRQQDVIPRGQTESVKKNHRNKRRRRQTNRGRNPWQKTVASLTALGTACWMSHS